VPPGCCGSGTRTCGSSAGTNRSTPMNRRSPAGAPSPCRWRTPASCSTCTAATSPTSSGHAWSTRSPTGCVIGQRELGRHRSR
jgi:hypothetical protein